MAGRNDHDEQSAAQPRFWRLRWWWARTFKTRDYRYVVNDGQLPDFEDGIYGDWRDRPGNYGE